MLAYFGFGSYYCWLGCVVVCLVVDVLLLCVNSVVVYCSLFALFLICCAISGLMFGIGAVVYGL